MKAIKALFPIIVIGLVLALGLSAYQQITMSSQERYLAQQLAATRTANQIARAEAWGQMGIILIYVAGGTLSLSMMGGAVAVLLYALRKAATYYAHDGDYGIQMIRRTLLERLILGGDQVTVIQPNHQLAPAATHTLSRAGDLHTSAGLDVADLDRLQRRADQHARTLQTQAASSGGGPRYAAAAKLLAGAYDKALGMGKEEIEADPLPMLPAPALSLEQAIRQSEGGQIVLGQNKETGDLAIWDSDNARQIAIFGANGTGKSASAAADIVLNLIRAGYHVIILDPKGGADWRSFEKWTERHDSDAERMGKQLDAVLVEMQRRGKICEDHGVNNVDQLPAHLQPPKWALVVEELGDTRIEAKGLGILDSIDTPLDRLMAMSRYTGLRIVLIDQLPQDWPKRVRGNTKALITFQQGFGQGNTVGYWAAHKLAPRGEFYMDGQTFHAFHALPRVAALLADVPALIAPRLIPPMVRGFGGSVSSAGVEEGVYRPLDTPPARTARTSEPNEPTEPAPEEETDLQKAARQWIAANLDGTQTAMREALGLSKGYASELWHKCHPTGNEYTPGPVMVLAAEVRAEAPGLDWRGMDRATLLDMMESNDTDTARQAFLEWDRRGERNSFGGE